MKQLKTRTQIEKEIKAGKRFFLWQRKGVKEISDFSEIIQVLPKSFVIREWAIVGSFMTQDQEISYRDIALSDWNCFLVSDDQANEIMKRILAMKIQANSRSKQ